MSAFASGDYTTPTFPDVPKNSWCYVYVEKAHEKGWINGYTSGLFGPEDPVSYTQLSVMLTQGFFRNKVDAYNGSTPSWYTKFCSVANDLGLFNGSTIQNKYTDNTRVNQYVSRYEMAQMIYNAMIAAGVDVKVDLNAAKASTADWNSIPEKYRNAVAAAKASGLISGIDSNGTFGGNRGMTRAQAAVVLTQLEAAIAKANQGSGNNQGFGNNQGSGNNQGNTTPSGSLVGTMSDTPVTLSLDTHKPIHDYWSSQDTEIRNLTDKDNFNAAVQTMRDVEMILTEGKFGTSYRDKTINFYYNYAMADSTVAGAENVWKAISDTTLRGHAYGNFAYMMGSRNNIYTIVKATDSDQLAEIFAPIFARFPANATDKQKVEICVREIVNRFDYATGTAGGFSWTNGNTKGNCESYARATSQILSAAGIPNMQVAGGTSKGPHAWVQAYIDGEWMIVDATCTEGGYSDTYMSFARHEQITGAGYAANNTDSIKVARALVEASLS